MKETIASLCLLATPALAEGLERHSFTPEVEDFAYFVADRALNNRSYHEEPSDTYFVWRDDRSQMFCFFGRKLQDSFADYAWNAGIGPAINIQMRHKELDLERTVDICVHDIGKDYYADGEPTPHSLDYIDFTFTKADGSRDVVFRYLLGLSPDLVK